MALSLVATSTIAGASGALPTHQANDLLVIRAYRDGSTTAPTLPTRWHGIHSGGANANSMRAGYKVAKGAGTASETWTNATRLIVEVWRGQHRKRPIGGEAQGSGSGTSVTYPAITMVQGDGTSWVSMAAGHVSINTALESPPSGTTMRQSVADATCEVALFDTNGGVASWAQQIVAVGGTSGGWRTSVIEIQAEPGSPPADNTWYVSTSGGTGVGNEADPWSLAHAVGGTGTAAAVLPGDTIMLRGGVYNLVGFAFSKGGIFGKNILYRSYPGEKAELKGQNTNFTVDDIQITAPYVSFRYLDLQGKIWPDGERANSHTAGSSVFIQNSGWDGVSIAHCTIHDGDDGIFCDENTGDVEIYGNIGYNCGNDTAPKGHNIYCEHNDGGGTLGNAMVEDNILFNSFGFACQCYASSGTGNQTGIRIRRNIMFNAGVLSTTQTTDTFTMGSDVAADPTIRCDVLDNLMVNAAAGGGRDHMTIGHSGDPLNGVEIQRNYMINGGRTTGFATIYLEGVINAAADSVIVRENIIHVSSTGNRRVVRVNNADAALGGLNWDLQVIHRDPTATAWQHAGSTSKNFADWKTATGKGAGDSATASDPTQVSLFYYPVDRYEAKRGHVAYLNWPLDGTVPVDLSELGYAVNDMYEIRDCRDPWGSPVASGTYAGGNINVDTTQVSDPAVVGTAPGDPPDTAPFMNALIVQFAGIDSGGGGGPGGPSGPHEKQKKVTAAMLSMGMKV